MPKFRIIATDEETDVEITDTIEASDEMMARIAFYDRAVLSANIKEVYEIISV